ncbi:MAG: peptidylprolyl isomerase [Amoebophilaceae bacterium]|jgi:peptidyl-prolyl cis-trans isomerase SurA|nr:peptidylprolyl isomerase [Amoebophilaceae bacterium]
MNIKQKCCLAVLCLASVGTALADPSQAMVLDKIIANVDNYIILQSELEDAYQQFLSQGKGDVPDLKCKILEQLLVNKMLLSKARQEGVLVDKKAVAQALNSSMQDLLAQAGSEARLVQSWGKPIQEIQKEVREKLEEQMVLSNMRTQLIKDIAVTPQEVREFFEALPAQQEPYYPAEVVVRQIVQYPRVSSQVTDALIAQLRSLKVRLQNGEDFEVLAQEYSQDLDSASQGGDIGFWRLGELVPAYEEAALALEPGEVSDPVITEFGFHLIQLIAREEDRYNSRHILLKSHPTVLDTEVTKTQLAQLRADILAKKITFVQAAINFSEDSLTAPLGGLLMGRGDRGRVLIDDLPPDVYFVIEELAPGAISDPVLLPEANGRDAVRLLFLEEKVAPHQANLAQDYAKIQQMLIEQRSTTALTTWFERAQKTTSIRVAPEYQHCALLR